MPLIQANELTENEAEYVRKAGPTANENCMPFPEEAAERSVKFNEEYKEVFWAVLGSLR